MVLVTGATGLLGSHVLLEVLKLDVPVRALIRSESSYKKEELEHLFLWYGPENRNLLHRVEWIYGDLLDIPSLEVALQGVQTVYHCAGMISFNPANDKTLLQVNAEGTRNLVNLCLEFGVSSFCHVSSIAAISGNSPIKSEAEDEVPAYSSGYTASKYLAEMEVWRGGQEGLPVVIVNPGVIIGPGDMTQGSGKLLQEAMKERRFCPPGGTGFIGVGDVARAILFLVANKCFGERYILVAENLSFCEIITKIANALNVRPPSKILKRWHLETLWRLDALRVIFGGRVRKITKHTAASITSSQRYTSQKFISFSDFEFENTDDVIQRAANYFRGQSTN
jgi:dihydroflavonol-4-reductase